MLKAARNDIDLWLVNYQQIQDPALLEQYAQFLSPEEVKRHERFAFTRDKQQFLVTRALIRWVLSQYLGLDDPGSLEFGASRNGKPELLIETTLQFNLTHTRGLIALAVMQVEPVGIDVEFLSRQADIVNLAERYFARKEAEELLALPVEQWNERFYDLWTLKEAYLKACGTGLRTPLSEFCFSFNGETLDISFSDLLGGDSTAWKFWQLDIDKAFRLSLAVNDRKGHDYRLRVKKGLPVAGFSDISPAIIRTSIR